MPGQYHPRLACEMALAYVFGTASYMAVAGTQTPGLRPSASISCSRRYGGKWVDGGCNAELLASKFFTFTTFLDHPCGWGRAGFGVGNVKASALVPDSAMNVCGWFGEDADQSAQKCELF